MTRMARIRLLSSCLLGLAFLGGCGHGASSPSETAQSSATRGQYLVDHVSLCNDCHTPHNPDGSFDRTRYLAGVECFIDVDPDPGKGCLNTRNLTPDGTGLKNRTDAQIKEMFQNGVTPTGKALIPVMPYWVYHNMTAQDADAVVAYLRTVPAVSHAVPPSEPPWAAPPHPAAPIDPVTIPSPSQDDPSAMRGRYLATMAGVCLDCHTPSLPPGGARPIDMSRPFAGGRDFQPVRPSPPFPPHLYSANLTQDATGLADWSADDVVRAMKRGVDRHGARICLMPSGPAGALGQLTDEDATDIAHYILTIPAIANKVSRECVAQ
ncbi:MAG TPA: hypothetical protein VKE22_03740 [Haliangiales bacterium]|nr:hypothetical protein [Haliangiales bacterium]